MEQSSWTSPKPLLPSRLRPILSQGFRCKIFVQDLDHFEREEILHGILLKTPSKFAIFFLGFEQDSVQDSVQDFLQDSFPPPHSPKHSTMACHVVRGRRGYRREYLYGRGCQWLKLKPRAWRIGRCTRIIFISGLSPSNSPAATVHIRRGGRRLC